MTRAHTQGAGSQNNVAEPVKDDTDMTAIPQNKWQRAGVGLRACDPDRASPGYTLFAPAQTGEGRVLLIDLAGNVVHDWELPYRPGLYGYLSDRGTLVYNGQVQSETPGLLSHAPFKAGVILEADWNGKLLWQVEHPDHHHDGRLLRNGNVILLCLAPLPPELAARVQGGLPGSEHEGVIYGDYLVEMTTSGQQVWEWRSWEHLDPDVDRIIVHQDRRAEWTHGNAVAEMPDGNLVVSFRNISTVVIVDRQTGALTAKLTTPMLAQQHAPTPLPNGNLLIFDNGTYRVDSAFPYSRVLEIDPRTSTIVWQYQDRPLTAFYSTHISNAQRLPNGNTLIDEGCWGRIFEVAPDGEVVWEYVNPYFGQTPSALVHAPNAIFRAYRYTEQEIARARSTVA
jgi:hypothetical protein